MTEHIQNREGVERSHQIQHGSTRNRQYKTDISVEIESILQIMISHHRRSSKLKNKKIAEI